MPYLIKYTNEIGTKRTRMKWKFIHRLAQNIRSAIATKFGPETLEESQVIPQGNHIIVECQEDCSTLLQRIFGIQYFTIAKRIPTTEYEQLLEQARSYFDPWFQDKEDPTFGVRVRKRGPHSFSKRQLEKELGAALNHLGEVDLDAPDIPCSIEIEEEVAFFYVDRMKGAGGAPLGIQGKALNLYSGGIDSPVAAWRAFRIGLDQNFLFFDLGSEEQKSNTRNLFKKLKQQWGYGSSGKLIEIDLVPAIERIREAPPRLQNLVLKYCFYYTAELVARFHGGTSLITGESIGQVSTQTSKNLNALDKVTHTMILRPLATFGKEEIMEHARRIGTFDDSYKGKEFCALTQKKVTTGSTYKELMKTVKELDLAILDELIEKRAIMELKRSGELVRVDRPKEQTPEILENSEITPEKADHVIDLRSEQELKGSQIPVKGTHIPFDQAFDEYFHWEKSQTYFLVCEYGSRSRIMAYYMRREGFQADHLEGGMIGKKAEQMEKV